MTEQAVDHILSLFEKEKGRLYALLEEAKDEKRKIQEYTQQNRCDNLREKAESKIGNLTERIRDVEKSILLSKQLI